MAPGTRAKSSQTVVVKRSSTSRSAPSVNMTVNVTVNQTNARGGGGGVTIIQGATTRMTLNRFGLGTLNSWSSRMVKSRNGSRLVSYTFSRKVISGSLASVSNAFGAGHQALNQTLKAGQRALTQMFRTGHWAMSRTLQAAQRLKTRAVDRVKRARAKARGRAKLSRAKVVAASRKTRIMAVAVEVEDGDDDDDDDVDDDEDDDMEDDFSALSSNGLGFMSYFSDLF
ncbi:uncharacterized protein LOC131949030 [Physella acuta]|uniref:uncharacterized protein LOC131949030 n=1 Tax=Physella acuta TaxID=109671 RepID=UPI0027DDCABE|nr:uncharacterized protein LOC131949030 [Physella acuta]XP_059166778.1 uncharacterized protein LOC131949030 [Physella acuta]